MPKYINADDLFENMFLYYKSAGKNMIRDTYTFEWLMKPDAAQVIFECAEHAPAEKVQKIKCGKWTQIGRLSSFRCSSCCRTVEKMTLYCPNCGSRNKRYYCARRNV